MGVGLLEWIAGSPLMSHSEGGVPFQVVFSWMDMDEGDIGIGGFVDSGFCRNDENQTT